VGPDRRPGRVLDRLGDRRLAQSFGVLVAARTLQGAFAALLAPSALGLLTVTFEGSPDRPTAFGIFGAIAGGGASLGLDTRRCAHPVLSWRWCLYVNLVIAVPRRSWRCGCWSITVPRSGRSDRHTGGSHLGAGPVRAGLRVLQRRDPLLDCHSHDRGAHRQPRAPDGLRADRAPSQASVAAPAHHLGPGPRRRIHHARAGRRGHLCRFLFLTYFLQQQLGLSPLTSGLAFLPLTGVLVVTSTTVQTRVIQHTGVKPLVLAGLALGAIAMFLFTRLTPGSSYASMSFPVCSSSASGWAASSRRRSRPRLWAWREAKPGSPRRWSTPPSRSAARSAPPCSARSSPAPSPATRPSPPHPRPGERRGSSRLHHGLLVVGRNLRPRLPSGDGDPPRPGQGLACPPQGCARPSRDRQLPLRGCGWRPPGVGATTGAAGR
jgi:Major Facilitator Superfamily.